MQQRRKGFRVVPQWTICIWRHRRAPSCVGGQTKHCHVGHRQACSQQANPCMPYRRAGRAGLGSALTEGLMRSASTTCARSAKSLDPQHGVVVMETWRQCIRSILHTHQSFHLVWVWWCPGLLSLWFLLLCSGWGQTASGPLHHWNGKFSKTWVKHFLPKMYVIQITMIAFNNALLKGNLECWYGVRNLWEYLNLFDFHLKAYYVCNYA